MTLSIVLIRMGSRIFSGIKFIKLRYYEGDLDELSLGFERTNPVNGENFCRKGDTLSFGMQHKINYIFEIKSSIYPFQTLIYSFCQNPGIVNLIKLLKAV